MPVDEDKIDEATLALLMLGLHDQRRVWKSFDWRTLARLHAAVDLPTRRESQIGHAYR